MAAFVGKPLAPIADALSVTTFASARCWNSASWSRTPREVRTNRCGHTWQLDVSMSGFVLLVVSTAVEGTCTRSGLDTSHSSGRLALGMTFTVGISRLWCCRRVHGESQSEALSEPDKVIVRYVLADVRLFEAERNKVSR